VLARDNSLQLMTVKSPPARHRRYSYTVSMKKYQQQSIPAEPAATSHQSRIPQISCRRREPPSKNQQRM